MVRLVTYNVRRCLGADGAVSPARIAEVLAECRADVIALQEVDVERARTGGIDQAHAIAGALNMRAHFHPAMTVELERYGDAILTNRPSTLVRAGLLPTTPTRRPLEPRGALWVSLRVGGARIDVINTHLGLRGLERLRQVEALLGPDWVSGARRPLLLVGDMNAPPRSRAYRRIAGALRDAQAQVAGRPQPTFPARLPVLRLDHVFVSPQVDVLRTQTIRTPLARVASDHLPLLVDFAVRAPS